MILMALPTFDSACLSLEPILLASLQATNRAGAEVRGSLKKVRGFLLHKVSYLPEFAHCTSSKQ
jgi:hypothetical protein